MTRTYRVCIIGCGNRSGAHIDAYQHLPHARVVACCAPSPTRRDPLAKKHGLKAYDDAEAMLRTEKPDLVHVVTWPENRVELLTLVSDAGVPTCTVEKPIATGVADWLALCQLEARSRTRFAVCHQFRWQEDLTRCREAIESGELGRVLMLDASAGMNISGQGTHVLDYMMSLNGDAPVDSVFASATGASPASERHPAPRGTSATVTFANGVRGVWVNGPTAPVVGDPTTDWQHVRLAAYLEQGRTLYEEFGQWQIAGPDGIRQGSVGDRSQWMARNLRAQAAFHQAMFDWIEDDAKAPGTHLRQSLHEWKVVLAVYASALQRQPIHLGRFDPPADLFERLHDALLESESASTTAATAS